MKMDFKKYICMTGLLLSLLLVSCCPLFRKQPIPGYRVITQVQIEYKNQTRRDFWQFYNENSIQVILGYLRHVEPYGRPHEDPDTVAGRTYSIRVIYSDGTQRLYEQHADRYMRIDGGQWKRIDHQTALYLSGLLGLMSSEAPSTVAEAIPPLIKPQI